MRKLLIRLFHFFEFLVVLRVLWRAVSLLGANVPAVGLLLEGIFGRLSETLGLIQTALEANAPAVRAVLLSCQPALSVWGDRGARFLLYCFPVLLVGRVLYHFFPYIRRGFFRVLNRFLRTHRHGEHIHFEFIHVIGVQDGGPAEQVKRLTGQSIRLSDTCEIQKNGSNWYIKSSDYPRGRTLEPRRSVRLESENCWIRLITADCQEVE